MTVPIKHVKLIIFENYNECKTKHVFDKKGSNTIWLKQIATWRKKSIDEEKNLLLRALKTYLWGLKEDPITEDPKENPFNEKPKEDPYYCET